MQNETQELIESQLSGVVEKAFELADYVQTLSIPGHDRIEFLSRPRERNIATDLFVQPRLRVHFYLGGRSEPFKVVEDNRGEHGDFQRLNGNHAAGFGAMAYVRTSEPSRIQSGLYFWPGNGDEEGPLSLLSPDVVYLNKDFQPFLDQKGRAVFFNENGKGNVNNHDVGSKIVFVDADEIVELGIGSSFFVKKQKEGQNKTILHYGKTADMQGIESGIMVFQDNDLQSYHEKGLAIGCPFSSKGWDKESNCYYSISYDRRHNEINFCITHVESQVGVAGRMQLAENKMQLSYPAPFTLTGWITGLDRSLWGQRKSDIDSYFHESNMIHHRNVLPCSENNFSRAEALRAQLGRSAPTGLNGGP